MSLKRAVLFFGHALLLAFSPIVTAQPSTEYPAHLAALYGEYQWVLAVREACNASEPKSQADVEGALDTWRDRHKRLINDLEERVAALVKKASKDQRDYSRNYARSQTEVLKQREDERKRLLALPGEELRRLCTEFPGYLRDARSDISTRLPEEFAAIYGRKTP
jgi:hypothetical protein